MTTMTHLPFTPWRSAREYQGQKGSEVGGLRLPSYVMESLGDTISRHLPEQYAVKGEWVASDGRRWLEFAVTTEYIEAVTDFRYDKGQRKLRIRCRLCEFWDGKHLKNCEG